jgi:glycosyltransferase involved in cell wall biosynthesis
MPEILLLCEYATLNGGERSMLATLGGVHAAGFTPLVMAPPQGPLAEALTVGGIELLPFECRMADGNRIPQPRLREMLLATLRRRRPALLHANSLAMGRLSGPVAAQLALPSVSHLRDIVRLSAQAVADLNCHRRLLAVSHATREFHVSGGLAAEKVHVLNNGVDLEQFRPRRPTGYLHRELGLPPKAQLIGAIGQIALRKGQDVLIDAARRIADRSPDAHYLIVGQRHSEKDESQRFERDLHDAVEGSLRGRVHFLGARNDVCQLLGELALLAHAARQEPLGRVLLEAAAAGTAIVATAVGGTSEIFPPDAGAAVLVSPGDAAALADAMLTLLGDPSLRGRLGSDARRRAEERFDVRTAVAGLIEHYRVIAS